MKELSVGEQRYKAVMAVLSDGRTVTEVARDWEVSRQTVHAWLARYEREGMEGMGNRSHRPTMCPHQMPALIEVQQAAVDRRGRWRAGHPFLRQLQGESTRPPEGLGAPHLQHLQQLSSGSFRPLIGLTGP
jgi:transposase-like protein